MGAFIHKKKKINLISGDYSWLPWCDFIGNFFTDVAHIQQGRNKDAIF